MRKFIYLWFVLLSTPVWAASSTECWERLVSSFEMVPAERLPQVLEEFFQVDLNSQKPVQLSWSGHLTASWEHPSRGVESKSGDSAIHAVIFKQFEVDGSETVGMDLRGEKAYGRFRIEIDNSKDGPIHSDHLTIAYSPSTQVLMFIRKIPDRNQTQMIQFWKGNKGTILYVFDFSTITLPDGSEYSEKATLRVAP